MNDGQNLLGGKAADFEPTLIGVRAFGGNEPSQAPSHSQSSLGKVAVVDAARPHLADETAALLRSRLQAAALVLVVAVSVLLVRGLFVAAVPLGWSRAMLLCALSACYAVLKRGRHLSLRQLRGVELILFGLVGLELLWIQTVMILHAAEQGDTSRIAIPMQMGVLSWFAIFMLYAMFIPNTWRRAALMIIPPALAPLAVIGVLSFRNPLIAEAARFSEISEAACILLIAASASVYGTHTINSLRTEAFKARQFGQYRLKRLLGAGGMGEVYLAEHQLLKRPCAIKLIRQGQGFDPTAIARFEREVRATAKLSHWNTVDVYDYGRTDDGTFYYVMEHLQGLSLAELVRLHGPLPAERVIHFLRQICQALREAHAEGLIHRDIKPANIFAAKVGGIYDVAKLLDFGLAKELTHSANDMGEQLTEVGSYSGSPTYMSPEQATAESQPDARSDIYSLGCVGYFLLTGRPPFEGKNPIRLMIAHARDNVVPPSQLMPNLPPDLEAIVLRCLAKNPEERFDSSEQLEHALAECQCAGKWTEKMATEWWRNAEGQ